MRYIVTVIGVDGVFSVLLVLEAAPAAGDVLVTPNGEQVIVRDVRPPVGDFEGSVTAYPA